MDLHLKGKRVFVTGGRRGIGNCVSEILVDEGVSNRGLDGGALKHTHYSVSGYPGDPL